MPRPLDNPAHGLPALADYAARFTPRLYMKECAHMNIYCDRFSECNSTYFDRGPDTEQMAQARGWVIWRGTTMGGKEQEVILCDKCVDASRRRHHQHKYELLPNQYPIPELTIIKPDDGT